MILGQLESYLSKIEIRSISHTLYQDEVQMDQRFKCKKNENKEGLDKPQENNFQPQNRKVHSNYDIKPKAIKKNKKTYIQLHKISS